MSCGMRWIRAWDSHDDGSAAMHSSHAELHWLSRNQPGLLIGRSVAIFSLQLTDCKVHSHEGALSDDYPSQSACRSLILIR